MPSNEKTKHSTNYKQLLKKKKANASLKTYQQERDLYEYEHSIQMNDLDHACFLMSEAEPGDLLFKYFGKKTRRKDDMFPEYLEAAINLVDEMMPYIPAEIDILRKNDFEDENEYRMYLIYLYLTVSNPYSDEGGFFFEQDSYLLRIASQEFDWLRKGEATKIGVKLINEGHPERSAELMVNYYIEKFTNLFGIIREEYQNMIDSLNAIFELTEIKQIK